MATPSWPIRMKNSDCSVSRGAQGGQGGQGPLPLLAERSAPAAAQYGRRVVATNTEAPAPPRP